MCGQWSELQRVLCQLLLMLILAAGFHIHVRVGKVCTVVEDLGRFEHKAKIALHEPLPAHGRTPPSLTSTTPPGCPRRLARSGHMPSGRHGKVEPLRRVGAAVGHVQYRLARRALLLLLLVLGGSGWRDWHCRG